MDAKLLWRWLRRIPEEIFRWIVDTTPLWFALAIPLVVWLFMGSFLTSAEIQIRSSGLALQVFGLVTIALGLNALRKELRDDGQGFGAAIINSLKRLGRIFYPIRPHKVTLGAGHVHARGSIARVSLQSPDLRGRVDALERDLKSIRDKMSEMERDTESRLTELSERSEKNHESLRKRFTSAHLKGLTPELVAIAWIILGMGMSSFPGEIAATFGGG